MDEIKFEVGSTYENEKGPYEVLTVDKKTDSMVIRWESGEEITTTVGFQRSIIERVGHEAEAAKAGPKRRKGSARAEFGGFQETDFSGSIAGTTWRTQKGLGGMVSGLLKAGRGPIKSWAVPRLPEIHWMNTTHRARVDKGPQAKLFARLDKDYLYYGFRVEHSKDESQAQDDWNGFFEWLSDDKNESWLKEIVSEYDLRIYFVKDGNKPFDGRIKVVDGAWHLENGENEKNNESLADFLKQFPNTVQVGLQVAKITGKDDTMAQGDKIAKELSGLFDALMPLYKASRSQA